jgi:hypothetical protein
MRKATVVTVFVGMALAFAIGVVVGSAGTKILFLGDGYAKAILEMSAVPPALPPHLKLPGKEGEKQGDDVSFEETLQKMTEDAQQYEITAQEEVSGEFQPLLEREK